MQAGLADTSSMVRWEP